MSYKDDVRNYANSKKALCVTSDTIPEELFKKFGVNRGLRDVNGKGVLTGLTTISKILSFEMKDGVKTPIDGELWYRGYQVQDLINELGEDEFGFEKTAYLLLFGEKPSAEELAEFSEVIGKCRRLPTNFTRDVIMKAPSKDIMNSMTRSILTLASYDGQTSDASVENSLRQCIQLIANFPLIAVYAYHAYNHYDNGESMYIHRPDPTLSCAENFLKMLRPDQKYTELEAKVLDVALMLHMEHGGGNNSTFTTRVVTSAGTDTYSAIAAAMSSLKGPKHGGANIKVMEMMEDIRTNVKDWEDRDEVKVYLGRMLDGEVVLAVWKREKTPLKKKMILPMQCVALICGPSTNTLHFTGAGRTMLQNAVALPTVVATLTKFTIIQKKHTTVSQSFAAVQKNR